MRLSSTKGGVIVPTPTPDPLEDAAGQYIDRVLDLLEDAETNPARLDSPALRHALVRLAGFTNAILEQHRLTRHQRCPACRRSNTSRHTPCAIQPLARLYLLESLEIAWWQTLNHHGRNITLDEVSTWLNAAHMAAADREAIGGQ